MGMIMENETPCLSAAWKTILKKYVNSGKKWYVVYIKTSMLIVERTGLLYIFPLVCY